MKADKKRISQVIYNLINNAINYTGDDLKVTIRITENQKDCKIEIIDTGKGIDEKDLPNIWNRYYKKEKNHKRNVVGTGLFPNKKITFTFLSHTFHNWLVLCNCERKIDRLEIEKVIKRCKKFNYYINNMSYKKI